MHLVYPKLVHFQQSFLRHEATSTGYFVRPAVCQLAQRLNVIGALVLLQSTSLDILSLIKLEKSLEHPASIKKK